MSQYKVIKQSPILHPQTYSTTNSPLVVESSVYPVGVTLDIDKIEKRVVGSNPTLIQFARIYTTSPDKKYVPLSYLVKVTKYEFSGASGDKNTYYPSSTKSYTKSLYEVSGKMDLDSGINARDIDI